MQEIVKSGIYDDKNWISTFWVYVLRTQALCFVDMEDFVALFLMQVFVIKIYESTPKAKNEQQI